MVHFYESTLIDTVDGFQCKSYSNEHPDGYIIVKPKYIPKDVIEGDGLKYRFLFEKCLVRFNLFANKKKVNNYLEQFKKKFPDYIYNSEFHNNWFFVVPENKIKKKHDCRKGLQELLKVPRKDLDEYLILTIELIEFLLKSGVDSKNLGITHSTLIGNYTYGKSDIDIVIFGKKNGWSILNYLETATHKKLKWKNEEEWREYYQTHKTTEVLHFSEEEYIKHMIRKRYEGTFGETVFTLFIVEEPDETWEKWGEEKYEPKGLATVSGKIINDYNSIVRPALYEIENGEFIESKDTNKNIPIKKVVTYSLPFMHQSKNGETVEACGLLELVTKKNNEKYYRLVIGYFDAYINDRREKEYLKVI